MTRQEWQKLEEGYKWRVFIELSAEQQHDFWRLKIIQVRDSLEWNKDEKEHIEKLYQLFLDNPDMYSEERDKEKFAKINEVIHKWVADAMEILKWTPNLIRGMLMECDDLLDKEGTVRVTSEINVKQISLKQSNSEPNNDVSKKSQITKP